MGINLGQETDSSAHLDVVWSAQPQSALLNIGFENNMATCFVYATVVLSQSTGLSEELCL